MNRFDILRFWLGKCDLKAALFKATCVVTYVKEFSRQF